MREIEIKVKLDNWESLIEQLEHSGCTLSAPLVQEDIVYSFAGDAFPWTATESGQFVLRLRYQDGQTIFTLKQQRSHELDNLELETVVENREEMKRILEVIGFVPVVEVKKVRRKCKFKDYEICLDEVEQLGKFVEIEKLTDDSADAQAVEEELWQVLEAHGLSRTQQVREGYDTQIFQLTHTEE